jgi:hypothetical protein
MGAEFALQTARTTRGGCVTDVSASAVHQSHEISMRWIQATPTVGYPRIGACLNAHKACPPTHGVLWRPMTMIVGKEHSVMSSVVLYMSRGAHQKLPLSEIHGDSREI